MKDVGLYCSAYGSWGLRIMDTKNRKADVIPFYIIYMTSFLNNLPRYFFNVTSTSASKTDIDTRISAKVR